MSASSVRPWHFGGSEPFLNGSEASAQAPHKPFAYPLAPAVQPSSDSQTTVHSSGYQTAGAPDADLSQTVKNQLIRKNDNMNRIIFIGLIGLGAGITWLFSREKSESSPHPTPSQPVTEDTPSEGEIRRVMRHLGRRSGEARKVWQKNNTHH